MKKIASIVLVIIGTIIGAGFASGKEIDLFFFRYQKNGFYGLILSAGLLGVVIYNVFRLIDKENINTYDDFLKKICGFGRKFNNILFYSIQLIIRIFLLISFYIMVAGFGAYFKQEFGINQFIGICIISLLCYCSFRKKSNALIKINTFLVPMLIFFILYLGFKNPYNLVTTNFDSVNIQKGFLISSIIYSSYNSILLIPILITMKKTNKKEYTKISIICTILLFLLGQTIFFLLFNISQVQNIEIPTVAVASSFNIIYRYIFGFVLLISIFTSCVSSGYAFLENFEEKRYEKINKIICISSVFVAPIGFSNLLNILYPFFGFLGLIQIILLFCKR